MTQQICKTSPAEGDMASDSMTVAALGRPFTLGMFYDAVKDELVPGVTLWDVKTLQDNIVETTQPTSAFQISTSDTTESKSSMLNIEASLKLSFMSGLVEVEGSANYLNDQKQFRNQSRVTFQYKATTNFKQLNMAAISNLNEEQRSVIERGSATHVVTGVLYGANAFFVFDTKKVEAESVQELEGSMRALIKKIPSFDVDGKVDIHLTEEEKALAQQFSCKFFGDFILESNPSTFKEAVKAYAGLPTLVRQNSVPLTVWLMPLKILEPKAPELINDISAGLLIKIEDVLDDLKRMETRCNDSLTDQVVEDFPQLRDGLTRFQKLCKYYSTELQKKVAKKLPSIREGKEDESSLRDVFNNRATSPFSHDELSKWMHCKEREVNVVLACVERVKGKEVQIVADQSELERELFKPEAKHSRCFVFTSLEIADPCLDAMKNYLDGCESGSVAAEPTYISDHVLDEMRNTADDFKKMRSYKESAGYKYFIAAIVDKKHPGASICTYHNGILINVGT
ncbi:verrucotoxin subunit beta-like isoform X1 [Stegastes partitus]|uniref:Verrucotoxin subunit beta-like isoform X1 n=1 Tax=Stegastes partitus TaxID=144197 RepID=A0A9Y4KAA1_9TELE|nr:PREDICTED: verrucotoxin subunit beta-like isoform X1 [Stegastes partitus]